MTTTNKTALVGVVEPGIAEVAEGVKKPPHRADNAPQHGDGLSREGNCGLTLSFPMTGWEPGTLERLRKLLDVKGGLIARALQIPTTEVRINEAEGTVSFPWFTTLPDPEVIKAVTLLLEKMISFARHAQRISPRPTRAGSDKYVMRCWLLRLGFIGDQTKTARKVLLRNLDGSAAWASPPQGQPLD